MTTNHKNFPPKIIRLALILCLEIYFVPKSDQFRLIKPMSVFLQASEAFTKDGKINQNTQSKLGRPVGIFRINFNSLFFHNIKEKIYILTFVSFCKIFLSRSPPM